ncbi:H2A superfamily domain-containing protein [Histoplasma capsulatum]|uniref:H2A superfamily domain-containing protein n=1 Tax=Ajellomyces capsulatus TaxID=5037 RepID=A0A8A1M1R8_AJECA|nr:H2A superfamily domain-containing protein [Histoplasma capsulatum]
MPSNTSVNPPQEEASGHSALPLTRIKKIIHLDEDIAQCSNNAAFVIAVATEMFIRYLAEQGHNVVKSERKPRRTIQYKDLATAVSRIDSLEFLADVIPKTTTYKQFKEKRAKETANGAGVSTNQRTLSSARMRANGTTSRERREDSMLDLNGLGDTHIPTSRPPMVMHSSRPDSTLVANDPMYPDDEDVGTDGDIEMTQ